MNLSDFINKLESELEDERAAIVATNKFIKDEKSFLRNTFLLTNSWPPAGEKAKYHAIVFQDLPHPIPEKIEKSLAKVISEMGFAFNSTTWSSASTFFLD
jgi:hypothetical protein